MSSSYGCSSVPETYDDPPLYLLINTLPRMNATRFMRTLRGYLHETFGHQVAWGTQIELIWVSELSPHTLPTNTSGLNVVRVANRDAASRIQQAIDSSPRSDLGLRFVRASERAQGLISG
ncbi:unnamed protein product [Mycena citricolor]|uniref:Uncharacterized protein n=1 Tax=Mycena citricolor TaxID=2018698 RepID=A0AAD2K2D4_9AGAR|nr:unnamed protein product [Mycena citricolor]CAK5283057.1 unnamed protein product [Mycena citricolor]